MVAAIRRAVALLVVTRALLSRDSLADRSDRNPPERWANAPGHAFGVALALITVAFVLLAIFGNVGSLPPPDFYSAAAQITPVLIVALAVEGRARAVWDVVPTTTRWLLVGSLLVGETVAIV